MDILQGELYCSYCEELFENTAQQRKHYKQDWHRYNLQLRLASRPAITEEKFYHLAGNDLDKTKRRYHVETFDFVRTPW